MKYPEKLKNSGEAMSFSEFKIANKDRQFTIFDYLHVMSASHVLHPDFMMSFARLLWPEFELKNGILIIKEIFDKNQYESLISKGVSRKEMHFWLNLLEITGLFDGFTTSHAIDFSNLLVEAWNAKLCREYGENKFIGKVIHDKNTNEVFVTIDEGD